MQWVMIVMLYVLCACSSVRDYYIHGAVPSSPSPSVNNHHSLTSTSVGKTAASSSHKDRLLTWQARFAVDLYEISELPEFDLVRSTCRALHVSSVLVQDTWMINVGLLID